MLVILTLPILADVQISINQSLKPEILSALGPSSSVLSESTILTIHLFQFSNQGGQLIKDAKFFSCTQSESNKHLTVPITVENEVSFSNKCSLIVTINHSDIFKRGLYWVFIKELHSSRWHSCNDKLVFKVKGNSLNNTTSCTLFYSKI